MREKKIAEKAAKAAKAGKAGKAAKAGKTVEGSSGSGVKPLPLVGSEVKPLPLAKPPKESGNGGGEPKVGSGSGVKAPGGGQSSGGKPSGGGKPKEEKKPAANFFAEGTVKFCLELHGKLNATVDVDRVFIEECQGNGKAGVKAFACRWLARFLNTYATVKASVVIVNGDNWKRKFMHQWYAKNARLAGVKALGVESFKDTLAAFFAFASFVRYNSDIHEEDYMHPETEAQKFLIPVK